MTNVLNILLSPAALIYSAVIFARNRLFDLGVFHSHKAAIPVVSVGNISMGGTGKTPLVDFVIKYYSRKGLTPAILSRGYKRSTKGVTMVSDGRQVFLGSREAGDECAMLAHNNPETIVVVAEKRKEGADFIAEHFAGNLPDVLVLDDGFQHRQLDRDLDIVVINSAAPFFNDRLIPAGRLREPRKNLDRADLLVLSKVTDPFKTAHLAEKLSLTGKPMVTTSVRTGEPVQFAGPGNLVPERAIALAGIGQPEGFIASLKQRGIKVVSQALFPDHADFPLASIKALVERSIDENISIVTTEKDYFRLQANQLTLETMSRVPCFYLPVEIDIIEGRKVLEQMLDQTVSQNL
ncbi:tetraacyldisaccharide 4'-kinase [Prosthecochloris sp. SCSIO W1101]|uniref:tetraacyldisaccharide 4'-kinase n=1 Tax=Prosthecochloris sp. SCSIO W1101 TaxID=2992242 RepID=UPI00223CC939|nr:tetraacyldisaccharide 4'-kinase [Prosthecochloris sp. SCSIO W1101]UZJ40908.1 tetraacyldisaccharide 4'-kinase [Prosthecochloris sp. SCSIO W1101]